MLGGDFNIIRGLGEKNKDNYDDRWPSLFNVVINSLDLKELELSGRKFTWANSLIDPTFERLDNVGFHRLGTSVPPYHSASINERDLFRSYAFAPIFWRHNGIDTTYVQI